MKNKSITKAAEFDKYFDEGGDISSYIVSDSIKRPGLVQKRVNVDFPTWVIESLDLEASRVGVSRQSLIKMWITQHLENKSHA
jgi:hypothetical protein